MRLPPWCGLNPAARIRKKSTFRRRSVGRFDRTLHRLFVRDLHNGRFIFDAVDEQNSVEMVDLVLEDTRAPAASLDAHRPVVESDPLDCHGFGAWHLASPPGDAQAPLVTEDPTARLDDLRVDQRN